LTFGWGYVAPLELITFETGFYKYGTPTELIAGRYRPREPEAGYQDEGADARRLSRGKDRGRGRGQSKSKSTIKSKKR
jgi:hypothetical protein